MTLPQRRRIFRRPARSRAAGRLPLLLLVALGVLGGGMVSLVGFTGTLFGQAPPPARLVARGPTLAVVGADTLRLHDTVVRLAGVLAPPRGQACHDPQGAEEDCGDAAATALSALIGDRPVECRLSGRDNMGRPVGRCAAGGVDLNRAVIAIGWAHATSNAEELAAAERSARAHHLGLWRQQD